MDADESNDQSSDEQTNLAASQTTMATQRQEMERDSQRKEMIGGADYRDNEDSKGPPLNDDSSSNVLFHPPAAHEEHSANSADEGSDAISL